MIILMRVDSKLVRCAKNLAAMNGAERVVAIDEKFANNQQAADLEAMAAPVNCKARCWGLDEGAEHLKKSVKNVLKTIVVVSNPDYFVELYKRIPELPKEVNFAKQPTDDQKKAVEELKSMGLTVYVQSDPHFERTDL